MDSAAWSQSFNWLVGWARQELGWNMATFCASCRAVTAISSGHSLPDPPCCCHHAVRPKLLDA